FRGSSLRKATSARHLEPYDSATIASRFPLASVWRSWAARTKVSKMGSPRHLSRKFVDTHQFLGASSQFSQREFNLVVLRIAPQSPTLNCGVSPFTLDVHRVRD